MAKITIAVPDAVASEAKAVLDALGLPLDVAVNCLVRQIAIKQKLPFELSLAETSTETGNGAKQNEPQGAKPRVPNLLEDSKPQEYFAKSVKEAISSTQYVI